MKKKYVKPQLELVEMPAETVLLAGSGSEPGNPYWDPPEEKEGCDTPWWCP